MLPTPSPLVGVVKEVACYTPATKVLDPTALAAVGEGDHVLRFCCQTGYRPSNAVRFTIDASSMGSATSKRETPEVGTALAWGVTGLEPFRKALSTVRFLV